MVLLRAFVVSVVLVAGAANSSAQAATIDLGRGPGAPQAPLGTLVGPEVAGPAVAYAYGTPAAGSIVASRVAGSPPRVAATLPTGIAPQLSLAASTGVLAVERVDVDCRGEFACHYEPVIVSQTFAAGPLVGPLASGPMCAADGCTTPPPSGACGSTSLFDDLDASADALLVRSSCTQRASVYSPAGRRDLGQAVAGALGEGIVALQRNSAVTPGSIEVSRLDGRPLYSTSGSTFGGPFAVTEDGSVAQVQGDRLRVSSVTDPVGRVVLEFPAGVTAAVVGAAHGRVALALRSRPALRTTSFLVLALDGTRVVALPAMPTIGNASFDGATLAFATRACSSARITTYRVGDPVPTTAPVPCPAPDLNAGAVRITAGGRLGLRLACPAGATGGCKGVIRTTARRAARPAPPANDAERLYRLGRVPVALDPGERGSVTIPVPSGAQRWIRRHRAGLRVIVAGTRRTRTLPARVLSARRR